MRSQTFSKWEGAAHHATPSHTNMQVRGVDRASQIERRHTGADLVPASVPVRSLSTVIEVVAGLACRFLPKCDPKHFVTLGSFCLPLGLSWLTLTDVRSTHEGSTLGPMLVFSAGMGTMLVPPALMALSDVQPAESGAASGLLNSTQQVGGSPSLSILVTVFGTASRNEADQQNPTFLARADPAERALFAPTGRLPPARVSAGFIAAAFAWLPSSPSRSAPPK